MISKLLLGGIMAATLVVGTTNAIAADLTPQTISRVDVVKLADAHRASKLIGAPVVNDSDQSIGKIDELLVANNDSVRYAVISVGGFLGVGSKLVAVPYQSLELTDTKVVLKGETKDELKGLPEFKYASR